MARKKKTPVEPPPGDPQTSLLEGLTPPPAPKTRRKKTVVAPAVESVVEVEPLVVIPHPLAEKAKEITAKLSTVFERARTMVELPDEEPKKKVKKAPIEDKTARMDEVRADLGECERCDLCAKRRNIVFGAGSLDANLMIVGEAPGAQEDMQGEPFVGPAGDMLNDMLKNVLLLERKNVYIANLVKCRPPDNRDPLPDEVAACGRFLKRQIEIVAPKILLVLGSSACHALLETKTGVMRSRGNWMKYGDIPAMPTFHPAFLLRQKGEKPKVHGDLLEVKKRLAELLG